MVLEFIDKLSFAGGILDAVHDIGNNNVTQNGAEELSFSSSVPVGAGLSSVGAFGRHNSVSNPDEVLENIRALRRNLLAEEKHMSRRNTLTSENEGETQSPVESDNSVVQSKTSLRREDNPSLPALHETPKAAAGYFLSFPFSQHEIATRDSLVSDSGLMVNKETAIDFSDIVQLERQVRGDDLHTLDDYMQLAVEISVEDTIRVHQVTGSLEVNSSQHFPLSHTVSSGDMVDNSCQCHLTQRLNLADAELPERTSLGDIQAYRRRFSLSSPLPDSNSSASLPGVLDKFASNFTRRLANQMHLHSSLIGSLHLHIISALNTHLSRVSTVDNVDKTDRLIVYWMRSVSFLTNVNKILLDLITNCINTYKSHRRMSNDNVPYPEIFSRISRVPQPQVYRVVTSLSFSQGLSTRNGKLRSVNRPQSTKTNARKHTNYSSRFDRKSSSKFTRASTGSSYMSWRNSTAPHSDVKKTSDKTIAGKLEFLDKLYKTLTHEEQQLLLALFAVANGMLRNQTYREGAPPDLLHHHRI
ncbi:hypothetical protein EB796_015599 [Bugula neritina]|uniref:Uncharacterized protein n=1 Tax=Bugula neritina TaxID=10212 RepID=A0A7J7JKY4_BUGNE|nr:hypothetical protein EB796_015599 [Bugula neritina]